MSKPDERSLNDGIVAAKGPTDFSVPAMQLPPEEVEGLDHALENIARGGEDLRNALQQELVEENTESRRLLGLATVTAAVAFICGWALFALLHEEHQRELQVLQGKLEAFNKQGDAGRNPPDIPKKQKKI